MSDRPKRRQTSDHVAMKEAFEARHWALEDDYVPSRAYIERILDRVEKNGLKAERSRKS